jgi:hypothetical protein
MEHACRPLTPRLATAAGQVHGEAAADGPLGWRLWAGLVLFSTTPGLFSGRVPREASVVSLTPHGRVLTSKDREFHGLSWALDCKAAERLAALIKRKSQK